MSATDPWEVDVAIVGGGPVGAALGALLGQLGVRVLVVEATTTVYPLPRAAHLDAEAMRILDAIGVAARLGDHVRPIAGLHFIDGSGDPLRCFDVDDQPIDQGWAAGYWFHQPHLERQLRRRLAELPSVTTLFGYRVERLTTTDGGTLLDVCPAEDGARRPAPSRIRAAWVVGADGARSTVRRQLGITLDDLGLDQPWLVVDAEPDDLARFPNVCQQICDPNRPATFVPLPDPLRRWEIMLLPGESPTEAASPDGVRRLLSSHVDPERLRIVRAVVYTFHALVARTWRDGRVLLAGDAAHQMPPFLGQGLCSGLRDAANLAWRLDLVLAGRAAPGVLDDYQAEREPHVRAITHQVLQAGAFIQTLDPDVARERDRYLRSQPSGSFEASRPPGLSAGALAVGRPGAGRLAPQPTWTDDRGGGGLDRAIGSRWLLLGPTSAELTGAHERCCDLLGPAAVASIAVDPAAGRPGDAHPAHLRVDLATPTPGWLSPARHDDLTATTASGTVALVRPDRYLVGTSDLAGARLLVDAVASHLRT